MSGLPDEHPEDKRDRIAGETYGEIEGPAFCAAHQDEMRCLIVEYSDGEAMRLFLDLREKFWARLWPG